MSDSQPPTAMMVEQEIQSPPTITYGDESQSSATVPNIAQTGQLEAEMEPTFVQRQAQRPSSPPNVAHVHFLESASAPSEVTWQNVIHLLVVKGGAREVYI